MVAAPLVGGKSELAFGIGPSGPGSAEVNHCGQILLTLERDRADPSRSDCLCDLSIEQRRGQLDGMARHDACVEAIEPA